jgi:prefoldin subunit 5
MQWLSPKNFMFLSLGVLFLALTFETFYIPKMVEKSTVVAWKSVNTRIDSLQTSVSEQIDKKLTPVSEAAAKELTELQKTTKQANGLLADVRKDIPPVGKAAVDEVNLLNSKVDSLSGTLTSFSAISSEIKPTIEGLNLMFRKDELPKAIPALVRDYRRVGDEIADTMVTVRDTVKTEAAPTSEAIRKSAQGTASETASLTKLTDHVDQVFFDLFLRPRTFWEKVQAWFKVLVGPAVLATH